MPKKKSNIIDFKKASAKKFNDENEIVFTVEDKDYELGELVHQSHNDNGMEIANFLSKHPHINKTFYPGLQSHQNYESAKKQMNGFGGIVSIEINGDLNSTKKFLENIEIFTLAESLGGVESLIEHPSLMTHASIDKKIRDELGITDNLVRLSIGIEDVEDLKKSLDNALSSI